MRNIICCMLSITVAYCSTSIDDVHQYIKEQYQKIADVDKNLLRWVEESHNRDENRACIVFKGTVLYVISHVVNSHFQLEDVNVNTNTNIQPEFSISMFDILYLYDSTCPSGVVALRDSEELRNTVLNSRNSQNKKLVEDMIRHFVKHSERFPKKLQDLGGSHIAQLTGLGDGSKSDRVEKLSQWTTAITDFLKRVELYVNDTKWAKNDVKIDSKHKQRDKKILLQEINSIDGVVQEIKHVLNTGSNAIELKLLSICLRVYNIIAGVQSSFKGENEQRVGYRDIKEIFVGIMHTEQIIDWLSMKYDEQILFLFNSKTPCIRCSEYIECCENTHTLWGNRVNIGCNYGWRDNDKQRNAYRIQTKVFNVREDNGEICTKVLLHNGIIA